MNRNHPLDRFAGSWAVVTGSARKQGLGYAFARQIAGRGGNLVLVDILNDELEARAEMLVHQARLLNLSPEELQKLIGRQWNK